MSQIGYMTLGAGLGPEGYVFAIALLLAHGFYKAGLFLGAGSVIHGMDDEQDMRRYGALARFLPVTYVTFGLAYLAIIGIPPFSGFFTKDPIIEGDFTEHGAGGWILGICALIGAGLTAFYMTRMMLMTWHGERALGGRGASARVAAGDDRADDRARHRLGRRGRVPDHQRPAAEVPRPGRRACRRPRTASSTVGRDRRRWCWPWPASAWPGSCTAGSRCPRPRRAATRWSSPPARTCTATRSTSPS